MFYKLAKRSFDLLSSSAALVALSPVFVFVTAGIKISSPGPVLYKSERVGLNGKPFTMLKFRSMHVKQENAVESEYIVNNERIFKFGSFLRKSKLDELPQLINVFLSDMSVVGPRPYPKFVVDRLYKDEYISILNVKPGLACHDSLFDYAHGDLFVTDEMKYENEIVPVRTELAKMYVENHGLKTDLCIIARTLDLIWEIVVKGKTEFSYNSLEREAVKRVQDRMTLEKARVNRMNFKGLRILVLDGAGKQTLAMVRGLKDIGCNVTVLCTSKFDTCYVSRLPDKKLLVPEMAVVDESYIERLLKMVSSGEYDVLMPIGELTTNPVTQHEEEFKKYVKLACAPRETYIKAFNKQITFDTAIENGIPCPYTRHSKQSIEDYLEKCTFPIIIKPRQGLGSIGFHKFEKREDFWPYMKEHDLDPDDYVVQEFVDFDKHIGCLFFVDQKENICTSYAVDVLRRFPIDAGSAVLLQTIDEKEGISYAGKLLRLLGWRGFADVAFMIDEVTGAPKLMEINGRIPQSIKMAFMCGYNISRQMLELAYDQNVIRYPDNNRFGMYLRHFDTDIAWFLKSPDRFRAVPSWFSWKNTQEILFNRDDRRPFFTNLLKQIRSYRTKMKKKQH